MKRIGLHVKCLILFELGKLELSTDLISSELKYYENPCSGRWICRSGWIEGQA
jgi:hypothetical protein